MIAYYFPPLGGAGVQRTLKFVKYLPEFGWQPHILTSVDTKSPQDPSLSREIPEGLSVTLTPILRLSSRLPWRVRHFISRWLLIVDEQIGWLPFANSSGRKVIAEHKIKLIYSTSAPYSSHLIARYLHHRTHLPWVADFRDPWMGNSFVHFPTALHRRINKDLERSVFCEADKLIMNTEGARLFYQHIYSDLPAEKIVTIPNGYDQDDMPNENLDIKHSTNFTIVHLGSLYQKTRSGEFFLTALHTALETGRLPPDKIRVRFIGNIDRETQAFVKLFKLDGNVDLVGYLPHRKALSQLLLADLLVLIPSYGAGSDLFVPGKLYEYLASGKPILCLADPGDCVDLILRARAGVIVPPNDVEKIASQLVSLYQLWQNGSLSIAPDKQLIQTFERKQLTGQLARIFDDLAVKTI
jgi:glycosyltransferase involved in cell wall biosynthesis